MYLARISFKFDGEIKSFSDKQKLREFSTTKPALQQMLKGLIQSRNTREEKRSTDTYRLKVRGWKNIFHANGKQKNAESGNSHIRQNRP